MGAVHPGCASKRRDPGLCSPTPSGSTAGTRHRSIQQSTAQYQHDPFDLTARDSSSARLPHCHFFRADSSHGSNASTHSHCNPYPRSPTGRQFVGSAGPVIPSGQAAGTRRIELTPPYRPSIITLPETARRRRRVGGAHDRSAITRSFPSRDLHGRRDPAVDPEGVGQHSPGSRRFDAHPGYDAPTIDPP